MHKDFDLIQRLDLINEFCAGKSVLHLGCTNYPYTEDSIRDNSLLHFELEKISRDLWGIDSDQAGIDILASHGSKQVEQGYLEKLEELQLVGPFDVILAGEMIEHLNNPGLFLQGVKTLMGRDTILIITTINAYCGMRFFYYGVRGKRGKFEPVHPDHVAYYSYSTLKVLLERHGYEIDQFLFYDIGREHRPHARWFLKIVNDLCVRLVPQWADGVIAVCKLSPS